MKHNIGNVSTSYIIRLILDDLNTFIITGNRQFNFCSESGISSMAELNSDWL
ncbi:hypothetical protein H0177_02615 [Bacillus cereus]|uniref:hypothetical protein n=1 Tax=Bacillus cereus TaxID=1396 RepID=UPI001C8E59EF|nr:hypothetical protein [Bacillus cereus]MBY0129157.1 hypothetical protein [Bacillus cereus]